MLAGEMTTVVDEILGERLGRLRSLLRDGPDPNEVLAGFVAEASPDALSRVNPHDFARAFDIDVNDAVALFLCGVRAELFTMEWAMVCNGCGEIAGSAGELDQLDAHYECFACDAMRVTSLDQCVQVLFTVHPDVRRLPFHEPEQLDLESFFFRASVFANRLAARNLGPFGRLSVDQSPRSEHDSSWCRGDLRSRVVRWVVGG